MTNALSLNQGEKTDDSELNIRCNCFLTAHSTPCCFSAFLGYNHENTSPPPKPFPVSSLL